MEKGGGDGMADRMGRVSLSMSASVRNFLSDGVINGKQDK